MTRYWVSLLPGAALLVDRFQGVGTLLGADGSRRSALLFPADTDARQRASSANTKRPRIHNWVIGPDGRSIYSLAQPGPSRLTLGAWDCSRDRAVWAREAHTDNERAELLCLRSALAVVAFDVGWLYNYTDGALVAQIALPGDLVHGVSADVDSLYLESGWVVRRYDPFAAAGVWEFPIDGELVDFPPCPQRGPFAFIFSRNRVYFGVYDGKEQQVLCLDKATGKRLWQRAVRFPVRPVLDEAEQALWYVQEGRLFRLDAETGSVEETAAPTPRGSGLYEVLRCRGGLVGTTESRLVGLCASDGRASWVFPFRSRPLSIFAHPSLDHVALLTESCLHLVSPTSANWSGSSATRR